MPMYDFRCRECERKFEELVRYDQKQAVRCPHCGGQAQELVSGFAVSGGGGGGAPVAAPRFT